jgi:hypothetical protein
MHVGDVFEQPGFHAEITALSAAGWPSAFRYRFEVDLGDPSLRWIAWNGTSFVDFVPPKPGSRGYLGPA